MMSYVMTVLAITIVILMITALQMQEETAATQVTATDLPHINIDTFDTWCEKHHEVYWPKKHGITIPRWEDWLADNSDDLIQDLDGDKVFANDDHTGCGEDVGLIIARSDADTIIQQLPAADKPAARKAIEVIGVYNFVNATRGGDVATLMKIPGIGVKRAAKMIAAAAEADAIAETVDEDDAAYYAYCQSSYVEAMREVF